MNLEELVKTVGLQQEKLHPAEVTTLVTLLEYDQEAASRIAEKIKAQVQKREQIEALRNKAKESFLEWLEKMNNGEHTIVSLSFRAPDQVVIRFSSDPQLSSSPRSRSRSRSRSSSSTNELLTKIEQLGYKVSVIEEQTRGGNVIKKYAVQLEDGSVLKDQWLKRLYERLQQG